MSEPTTLILRRVTCPNCGREACGHLCQCDAIDVEHRYCCWCKTCYLPAKETKGDKTDD